MSERKKGFWVRAFVPFIYACSFQFEILNARSRNILRVSVGRQGTGNLPLGFRRLFGRLNWPHSPVPQKQSLILKKRSSRSFSYVACHVTFRAVRCTTSS